MKQVTRLLVDRRNYADLAPTLKEYVAKVMLIGADIETHDNDRHDGLNRFMKVDPEGFGGNEKLIFDTNRTTVCGLSIYPDDADFACYFNINHADVENRLTWAEVEDILLAAGPETRFICHNSPFEMVMLKKSVGFEFKNLPICTLQMAVSAYGPDEYSLDKFIDAGLGGMAKLLPKIARVFAGHVRGQPMNPEQSEIFAQVIGKESRADFSYNGFVNDIAWHYDLKRAVKSWFNYEMVTFEQVLGDKPHMGALTGDETAHYGCDDSIWAVRLYHALLDYMLRSNPKVVETFFNQELPMTEVYAETWAEGVRIDKASVERRRDEERIRNAKVLKKAKAAIKALLPFPTEPNEKLAESESWYAKNWRGYRKKLEDFANTPDVDDPYKMCRQARGPVVNAWAAELHEKEPDVVNLAHYMPVRTMFYDLMGEKIIRYKGKVQSDAETRGKILERLAKDGITSGPKVDLINCLSEIAGIEQRMKLYFTPYLMMVDPDTSRIYPITSSKLASRRTAMSNPNGQQLAKRGESVYVRGFYQADDPDEDLLMSFDWQQIELVEIGEFSGDPVFAEHYGQLPYKDMHIVAAADAVDLTVEQFMSLPGLDDGVTQVGERKLLNASGQPMTPKTAYKYWRTELGKGSNFNYFYSGALSSVGETMGWDSEEMWSRTESYRQRFQVAESWRQATIQRCQEYGYLELPDGHRRIRFEATAHWAHLMREKWHMASSGNEAIMVFAEEMIRAVQRRANNQAVNSLIQGTCATLAKRSILRIRQWFKDHNIDKKTARFVMPIHDELVFNVNRRFALKLISIVKQIMCDHKDIFKILPINSTVSVGRNFEPFGKKALFGQVELDEAPAIPGLLPPETEGQILGPDDSQKVIDWLFREEPNAANSNTPAPATAVA